MHQSVTTLATRAGPTGPASGTDTAGTTGAGAGGAGARRSVHAVVKRTHPRTTRRNITGNNRTAVGSSRPGWPATVMLRAMRVVFLLPLAALLGCSSDDTAPACTTNCPGSPGAPAFGGVVSVAPARERGELRVSWAAATDDSPSEQLRYRIYASTASGRALSRAPILTTTPGATSAILTVAPAEKQHFIVVRAIDPPEKEDGNRVEKSAAAGGDTTPPTFGGVKAAAPANNGGVTVRGTQPLTTHPPQDHR